MFTAKKNFLFKIPTPKTSDKCASATSHSNQFLEMGAKVSAEIESGNGALKYKTTGDPAVDQFTKIGTYRDQRLFHEVAADCEVMWAQNPRTAVLFIFYLRTINRIVNIYCLDDAQTGVKTQEPQKGAELKHEPIFRLLWLHNKAKNIFWANIGLFISLGSWKDVIQMLQYDLIYNGWESRTLDWSKFGQLILTGLKNKQSSELIKKYLPQIKSKSKCKTVEAQADNLIAKWICSLLFGSKATVGSSTSSQSYKQYRHLKVSGTAHEWQQLISQKKFEEIDFNSIHGRALSILVKSKHFLDKSGLREKYQEWVAKPTTEVKFTGFVHELFSSLPSHLSDLPFENQTTINKQFETLIQKGKTGQQTKFIVVRDTSASMGSPATGTTMSCFNVAKALALYFSEYLSGTFQNSWIEFNSDARMHTWTGSNPIEKWYNDRSGFVGSTDFQSVIRLFCSLKARGVPEADFPSGILCISDSEFNPTQTKLSNVETALDTLRKSGFSDSYVENFVIVLWNLQSRYYGKGTGEKFETYGSETKNVFYFSGYSASVIGFLTDKIKSARELFDAAMDQEVLNLIETDL